MLSILIFLPLLGGVLVWLLSQGRPDLARPGTVAVAIVELGLGLWLWANAPHEGFYYREQVSWIPLFGIQYLLAMDGVSLILTVLTAFITLIAALVAWGSIGNDWPVFGALLLAVEGGLMGVFVALDLLLFYVFWEVMLIPMYLMLVLWGGRARVQAAVKFMMFTITGSLLFLVALIVLFISHRQESGVATFDYFILMQTPITGDLGFWLLLGFLLAFAVKIPVVPLHVWAPDTYSEANPAVTIMLAGAMANAGAYGIFRFCLPLFPEAAAAVAPVGMALGAIAVVYAGLLALVQDDIRRLAAYSSVSHMGIVVLGLFAWERQSLSGVVVQIVAHGLAVAGLFAAIAMLQERGKGRSFDDMGGLFRLLPRLGVLLLFFTLSGMALPGLANFAGEFLVLAGSFRVSPLWSTVATFGIIISVVYFLRMYERAMLGPLGAEAAMPDIGARETATLVILALAVLWVGLYPMSFLAPIEAPVAGLLDIKPLRVVGVVSAHP
jgi:NADH-quinone oxidoreductase subunit M